MTTEVKLPEVIGPYRIKSKLGQGGMGAVYHAVHETLERPVALKILPPEFASSPEYVSRFLREARTVATLRHDHIVQVYDAGSVDGKYYIAMELVDGMSLEKYLQEKGRLDEKEGLELLLQAAKGLAAAHAKELVHRDIKPDNLLLDKNRTLRIVDFGLVMESSNNTQLTATGACLGTPMYMSPEQADGEKADERTDLYSLGVTFYKVFTGQPPFTSPTVMNLLFKHKFEAPPEPRTFQPALSQNVSNLLLTMMAKRRVDRPASAQAVVELIEGIRKGKKVPPPPPLPANLSGVAATLISPTGGAPAAPASGASRAALLAGAVLGVVLLVVGIYLLRNGVSAAPPGGVTTATTAQGKTPEPQPAPPVQPEEKLDPHVVPDPAPPEPPANAARGAQAAVARAQEAERKKDFSEAARHYTEAARRMPDAAAKARLETSATECRHLANAAEAERTENWDTVFSELTQANLTRKTPDLKERLETARSEKDYQKYMQDGDKAFGEERLADARGNYAIASNLFLDREAPKACLKALDALLRGDKAKEDGKLAVAQAEYEAARAHPRIGLLANRRLGGLPREAPPPKDEAVVNKVFDFAEKGQYFNALALVNDARLKNPGDSRLPLIKDAVEAKESCDKVNSALRAILNDVQDRMDEAKRIDSKDRKAPGWKAGFAKVENSCQERQELAKTKFKNRDLSGWAELVRASRNAATATAGDLEEARDFYRERAKENEESAIKLPGPFPKIKSGDKVQADQFHKLSQALGELARKAKVLGQ